MSYSTVRDRKGDIPQFQAQRTSPIYEYITRKFYCEENVVGDIAETKLTQLSWNIHTPQDDFIWKSVKLHVPLKITAKSNLAIVSMRLSDRNPACNIALSACPMKMFTDCQLILNGNMFSVQPNFYETILDTCYQSRDENSWMSSHSLKPNACRNIRKETETNGVYPLVASAGVDEPDYIQIHDGNSAISDHAFDLTFANPGFNSRVRSFQTDLQGSTTDCQTELVSYLHLGPFMRRVRKMPDGSRQYNSAVPYVKDFSLKLMCDKAASQYDRQKGNIYNEEFPGRTLANSILEWGTPVNMRHIGESMMPDVNWADHFVFEIMSKPYLEVEYVKLGEQQLAPSYKLRALTYQYENSDPFSFSFPNINSTMSRLVASKVPVRLNSRLLEVCSKVYLWAELAQNYKKSFFMGGTQRCARIENLHLRINNRSDILFEPTQISMFDNFKKLTSNAWGLSTWEKSPIYVFDPSTFGLQEYLSGQSQLMTYEWHFDVTPTELMVEEFLALNQQAAIKSMGYTQELTFLHGGYDFQHRFTTLTSDHVYQAELRKYINWIPSPASQIAPVGQAAQPTPSGWGRKKNFIASAHQYLSPHQTVIWIAMAVFRNISDPNLQNHLYIQNKHGEPLQQIWTTALRNYIFKPTKDVALFPAGTEMWRCKKVMGHQLRFDQCIWGLVDISALDGVTGLQTFPLVDMEHGTHGNGMLWYVPESSTFEMSRDNYQKTTGNLGIMYTGKKIFNSLADYNFQTNLWEAGKQPVWQVNVDDADGWVDDIPGEGFITGRIIQVPADGGDVETKAFNAADAPIDSAVCPGMRAYPLNVTAGAITGILNIGNFDGGPYRPDDDPHFQVRGGQRAEAEAAPNARAKYQYIPQHAAAARGAANYKWICFQLTDAERAGLPGLFLNAAGAADQRSANGVSTGDIQFYQSPIDGSHMAQPAETHMLQCVFERNVFNSRTVNAYTDYGEQKDQPHNHYGVAARYGYSLGTSAVPLGTTTESDSLKFQANVLYEFGQKSYIIERDGKMVEDYPSISRNENLVQGRSFAQDKRTTGYQNTDARDLVSALDQFNVQG